MPTLEELQTMQQRALLVVDNLANTTAIQLGLANARNPSEVMANFTKAKQDAQTQLNDINQQIQKLLTPITEKVIPNNKIIGPPLVSGQTNQIPILPIAAGVGIIILAVAISKRRKR